MSAVNTEPDITWGEPDWSAALCAQTDPEAFFVDKGGSTKPAKRVCAACAIREGCLEYALIHDQRYGVWGGTSERERRRLRHERQKASNNAGGEERVS